ncbi:MAG: zinc ABC transporter substrate-binding protein [Kiritimatiellae bacterium]|nr:zinc ABC transporter substrate-binding protein [Kiritimatiellia bacterium]
MNIVRWMMAAWCAGAVASAAPLRVLATTPILADVAAAVAGPGAVVESLMPPDADAHAFHPRPADAVRIQQADVVLLNGFGLEEPLAALLDSAGSGRQVTASEGLVPRRLNAPCASCAGHAPGEHEHAEGAPDPHVWMDPQHVAHWAGRIAEALAARDPEGAAEYRVRAAEYRTRMNELDQWIRSEVEAVPEARRRLVSDHESFGYFCDRYGFIPGKAILPGFSTLAQPSAREIARLEDALRSERVPAIFVGTTTASPLPGRVAGDLGIRVVKLHTCTLGPRGSDVSDYTSMMKHNVRAIVEALK